MTEKYFISRDPRINVIHTVHRQGCPFLPTSEKRILLGVFGSSQDAVKKGSGYFRSPAGCPFCLKEYNEKKKPAFIEGAANQDFISSSRVKTTWESLLFCSVS
jgi:hypothetical protein